MKYQFMVFSEATLKRFWSKVDKRGLDECWEWQGRIGTDGYGQVQIRPKKYGTHRLSLIIATQENRIGMNCLHSCDNRKCVNPNHLRWGTQKENMLDVVARNPEWRKKVSDNGKKRYLIMIAFRKNKGTKLSDSQKEYIVKLYNNGYSKKQIARWYLVDSKTIRTYLKNVI